jgi:DNA-binding NtrC family response regulator
MEKSKTKIVIIEDDNRLRDDPFIIEAELLFDKVLFFDNPVEGLQYIDDNLDKNNIVLLDLNFPQYLSDGHKILQSIRDWSFLIPVIIWSGRDEDKETFSDLINNKAFAFLKKSASTQEMIDELLKADNYIQNDISSALEEWINAHSQEQKEKPYLVLADGKQLTLNEILKEIRMQTPIGMHFSKNLLKLTIDLISRNKEQLND